MGLILYVARGVALARWLSRLVCPMVRIGMGDGLSYVVFMSYGRARVVFESALRERTLIRVECLDGKLRYLNPLQLVYIDSNPKRASSRGEVWTLVRDTT